MKKKDLLWYTTLGLLSVFALILFTGLINWLVFTGGHGTGSQSSPSVLRYVFCNIHIWSGVLFVVIVGVHLLLHGNYLKNRLKKSLPK